MGICARVCAGKCPLPGQKKTQMKGNGLITAAGTQTQLAQDGSATIDSSMQSPQEPEIHRYEQENMA